MRQVWEYETYDGKHIGLFNNFYDHGGTDVTYQFHRLGADGMPIVYDNGGIRVDMVSGSRLKAAKRIGAVESGKPFKRG